MFSLGGEPDVADPLGDVTAHELERLRTGLRILALRRLGDPDAAEEVAQESLARTIAALRNGKGPEPSKLGAFVAGVGRHVIADMHREQARAASLDTLPSSAQPRTTPDPLATLISAAERAAVHAALTKLSAGDREILRLCFFDGLTPSEVARRLGQPATRIRKRKSRALERLRAAFLGKHELGHEIETKPTE